MNDSNANIDCSKNSNNDNHKLRESSPIFEDAFFTYQKEEEYRDELFELEKLEYKTDLYLYKFIIGSSVCLPLGGLLLISIDRIDFVNLVSMFLASTYTIYTITMFKKRARRKFTQKLLEKINNDYNEPLDKDEKAPY